VTQPCGTEPAFRNAYWDNYKPGLYVDVLSGEPLFSSLDKFDSGTGWPSFTRPVKGTDILEKRDAALGMVRTEVHSKVADNHGRLWKSLMRAHLGDYEGMEARLKRLQLREAEVPLKSIARMSRSPGML
jgi:hypothetical protein